MGTKRLRAVRESLAGRFRRPPRTLRSKAGRTDEPAPIDDILSIDDEYRRKAETDRLLRRVAPALQSQPQGVVADSPHAPRRTTTRPFIPTQPAPMIWMRSETGSSFIVPPSMAAANGP